MSSTFRLFTVNKMEKPRWQRIFLQIDGIVRVLLATFALSSSVAEEGGKGVVYERGKVGIDLSPFMRQP